MHRQALSMTMLYLGSLLTIQLKQLQGRKIEGIAIRTAGSQQILITADYHWGEAGKARESIVKDQEKGQSKKEKHRIFWFTSTLPPYHKK